MEKLHLIPVILLGLTSASYGQAPDASTIQDTLNQGIELEFSHFQEITDVVVLQGGATADNDFLFICTGRLMWKLSAADFTAVLQQEIEEEVQRQGENDDLRIALNIALSNRLKRIDSFAAGGTVTLVRFRVRLGRAGTDWIVTDSKFKESDRNPLSIFDQ
jgi:hypothetical protein